MKKSTLLAFTAAVLFGSGVFHVNAASATFDDPLLLPNPAKAPTTGSVVLVPVASPQAVQSIHEFVKAWENAEQKIAFNPAVEISYLTLSEQTLLLDAMAAQEATPSLSQAQRLKKFSQQGKLSEDVMMAIMSEEKKDELDRITLKSDVLRKYFPRSYTPVQMEQIIIKLLEQWQKKRQRENER